MDQRNHGLTVSLASLHSGQGGAIAAISPQSDEGADIEMRLIEIGFLEGGYVEVLHEGPMGGDPMVVRLNDSRLALRRKEAAHILIAVDAAP